MTLTRAPADAVHPPLLPVRRPPALDPPDDDLVELGSVGAIPGSMELPIAWDPLWGADGPVTAHIDPEVQAAERAAAIEAADRYLRICLEALNGFRPATHLRRLPGAEPLVDAVTQLARRRNIGPMIRRVGQVVAASPPGRRPMRFGEPRQPADTQAHFHSAPGTVRSGPAASTGAPPGRVVGSAASTGATPARVLGSAGAPPGRSPGVAAGPGGSVPGNSGRFYASATGRSPRPASPIPTPFRLRRLRHSSPRPGVAEIVAILVHADVTVACAIRMELRDGAWRPILVQVV